MALIHYTITASSPTVKVELLQITPTPTPGSEVINTIYFNDTASDPDIFTDAFVVDSIIAMVYQIRATDAVNQIVLSDLISVDGNSYAYLVDFDGTYLLDSDGSKLTVYNL